MNYKLMIPVLAVVTVGAVALTAHRVSAQETSGGYSTIVSRLAEKFGLNQAEVQSVFTQVREEHQVQLQTQFEQRLNDAVSAEKLTEEQKQAILAKHQELRASHEAEWQDWQNLTQEERQAQMEARRTERQTQHDELEAWAQAQGIDMQYLFGLGFEGKGGSGPGGMGRHGMMAE